MGCEGFRKLSHSSKHCSERLGNATARDTPEERGLYNANGSGVPSILLCHGQDCYAHVDSVHIAQHEGNETQANDGPSSIPPSACCNNLPQEHQ